MTAADLIDRLAAHKALAGIPRAQLAWVAAHGQLRAFAAGEILVPKDGRIDGLWIVLSGHFSIRINRGAGPRKVMEWRGGDVTGALPYSRMVASPGDAMTEEPTEVLVVHRDVFPEMIRECHELTSILVHVMLDRARHFTSSDFHDEKMVSLGKLSAGLAHELNNPASAVARSAKGLVERLAEAEAASRALGAAQLSANQLAAVDQLREQCVAMVVTSARSAIEQADREDTIAEWLDAHGLDAALAEDVAESTITLEDLERVAAALEGKTLEVALRSVVADCAARRLAAEIESAATRIHRLVTAIKGFTYMDQGTPKPVDIGQGLADTLAVLKAKARAKAVSVNIEIEPNLPRIDGFGGELNQVWANLIDNALDAVPNEGHVEVTARRHGNAVTVRVVDDGPGISKDIQERIFDPFFTTKQVGQGTGLGLDIARRLVHQHDGEIEVESERGRTEFRVTLPVG